MTDIEIDTSKNSIDYETQIMKLETSTLLEIYGYMANNPTVFQVIADELDYRNRGIGIKTTEKEKREIKKRLE